jgi:hypothetical protein
MSAGNARSASTKQAARELWKIAQEYQAEAAKLDNGRLPDLGDPPQGLKTDAHSRGGLLLVAGQQLGAGVSLSAQNV